MNKTCSFCKVLKDISCFSKHRTARDGYRGQCKSCENNKHREGKRVSGKIWRDAHREHVSSYRRDWNKKLKLETMAHYGGAVCSCCEETNLEFLCFDHIEGGGTQHRKKLGNMGRQFYYWLKMNAYPAGYQVLCYNCNMSLGFYGYCPHRSNE